MDTPTPALYLGDRVAWRGTKLVIADEELLARVNRPYLSASTAKAMHSCPSRMVADRAMPSGFDLFGAPELGTAAHSVLERLFGLPPGRRDKQHAAAILTEMTREAPVIDDDVDYARAIGADPVRHTQWVAAVSNAYSGVFEIEDPTDVQVYATELRLDGIEIAGVPFKGFIDRIDVLPDGGLRVVDFKTGKDRSKVNKFYDDDHGDQIRLYVEALTVKLGEKPKAGHLYYIQHGKQRRVAISNTEVNKTKRGFVASWKALQEAAASGQFDTKDSPLCGWCPLVNSCPLAAANGRTDRKGGAPSAIDLGIPSLRPDGSLIPLVTPKSRWSDAVSPAADAAHMTSGDAPRAIDERDTMSSNDRPWREAKPYDGAEVDGHLSLNSYAATAVFGLSTLAAELLAKADMKVGPTPVKAIAGLLAQTVLDAQAQVTNGSRDWQDGANTRLRGALRSSLDVIPLPFGGNEAAWADWKDRTQRFMVAIAATAIDLYNSGPTVAFDALAAIQPKTTPAAVRAAA